MQSINYVTSAQFFYPSMGMTAMTSIFIGAAFYNGEIRAMWKGAIAIGSYAGLLLLTTISRIIQTLQNSNIEHSPAYMAYAGVVTIFFLTIYYILGMIIGVYTVKRVRKN